MMKTNRKIQSVFFLGVLFATTHCRMEDAFYTNTLRSDVFYQASSDQQYDFLWVFDNSASMDARRQYVKDNLQTFLNILNSRKAIDYQMAMVTTDYFSHSGNLVANPSGLNVVRSISANPIADFASIINNIQDTATSFWEQGLESSYQAVRTHGGQFMRNGVPLIMVYLTDEQDWSCKDNCFGVEPENNTTWTPWEMTRYEDYFSTIKANEGSTVSVFPIVGIPNSTECVIASAGARYVQLQEAVGNDGQSGSICNGSLQESYENIARVISDRGVKFVLSSLASGVDIRVFVNGSLIPFVPENYIYEVSSNAIIFTGAIPAAGSVIEVSYPKKSN